ncbi:sulfite exporter TauE/SafE family protein [Robertkochia solimangrovi]|uniref:sulfite exporter TauE/SafE family protein n=1 Tax=Robertkochia solimangrovi TaxID=2213046 RepID=UPI00117D47C4|nr:sulfite exporter TauE/SafE family protein [Robertkochia solimangrovi]TRZ46194.1 sulfite exporter TauE/SafE family protein [Robertkochia solimangrovi]
MLWSAVIFGFLGSMHCIGMCGPIAFMLPLDHDQPVRKFIQMFTYHFGRLLSYGFLGVLFGFVGKGFFMSGMQQRLSIVIGVLMILTILLPLRRIFGNRLSNPLSRIISSLKSQMGKTIRKKRFQALFTMGILNGFLPCGLVYMALFGALAVHDPGISGIYMILFGIGTIPMMSAAVYLGNFISVKTRQRLQKLIPVFVVLIGLVFILRGLGLGIPYLSPADMNLMVKANPECIVP